MKFSVLGSGRWGTAMAYMLGQRDDVYLWGRDEALIKRIQFDRTNDVYLPGVELPYEVRASHDLEHILGDTDVLLMAVPSYAYKAVFNRVYDDLPRLEALISLTTGFDPENGRRWSQEYLERRETLDDFLVLSGPVSPGEIVRENPTTAVLAGGSKRRRRRVRDLLHRDYFRVHPSEDLIGVETLSALKGLVAFAAGMSDGLGFQEGTRASLLTRGFTEVGRIVDYEDGDPDTVRGLAGLGGIAAEATSDRSPNYELGRRMGEGDERDKARSSIQGTVECVENAVMTHERILRGEIKAPLLSGVYGVLHEDLEPFEAVGNLMRLEDPPSE